MDLEYYKKRAPPGYRFDPTDCEMLGYLHQKKKGDELANLFKDVPLYDYDPDKLQSKYSAEREDDWYVFFKTAEPLEGLRMKRKVGNVGRWEVTVGDEDITDKANIVVGYKKKLRFLYVRDGKEVPTAWKMVEYRLAHANGKRKTMDNLFFCKLYKKSRGSSNHRECEAQKDENIWTPSMADNDQVDVISISSRDSLQCLTHVTNGLEHKFMSDVFSLQCVQNTSSQLPESSFVTEDSFDWNGMLQTSGMDDVTRVDVSYLDHSHMYF